MRSVQSDSQISLGSKLEPSDGNLVDPPADGAGCRATRRRGFAFLIWACTRINAAARS